MFLLSLLLFLNACKHEDNVEPVVVPPIVKADVKVTLEKKWSSEAVLKMPESAVFDPESKFVFVSNVNLTSGPSRLDGDGFISKLKNNGEIEKVQWITGLNDPQGLTAKNGKLYVTDIHDIVEIDINQAKITNRITVTGSTYLNDLAIDEQGIIYTSDYGGNKVYKIANNVATLYLEGEALKKPNGLIAEKDRLIIGNTTAAGEVKLADAATKTIEPWATGIAYTDGLTKDSQNNYFASSFYGQIFLIKESGETELLLDTRSDKVNSADISYMEEGHIILVPAYSQNRVDAYQVKYNGQ
jgi:hypothetical protein